MLLLIYRDGASLCGIFLAVHNAIQQLKMDDGVDVFTTVRQLQIRRPELCGNVVSLYKGYPRSNAKLLFLCMTSFFVFVYWLCSFAFSFSFLSRRISLYSGKYSQIPSINIFFFYFSLKMSHHNVILYCSFFLIVCK